jgi:hypothetical protein
MYDADTKKVGIVSHPYHGRFQDDSNTIFVSDDGMAFSIDVIVSTDACE